MSIIFNKPLKNERHLNKKHMHGEGVVSTFHADASETVAAQHSASPSIAQSAAPKRQSSSSMSSPEDHGGDVSVESWTGSELQGPAVKRLHADESQSNKINVSACLHEPVGSKSTTTASGDPSEPRYRRLHFPHCCVYRWSWWHSSWRSTITPCATAKTKALHD